MRRRKGRRKKRQRRKTGGGGGGRPRSDREKTTKFQGEAAEVRRLGGFRPTPCPVGGGLRKGFFVSMLVCFSLRANNFLRDGRFRFGLRDQLCEEGAIIFCLSRSARRRARGELEADEVLRVEVDAAASSPAGHQLAVNQQRASDGNSWLHQHHHHARSEAMQQPTF